MTAKRLVWGKFVNAGQTCIAPDYLLVKDTIKSELIEHLKIEITSAYGENPENSEDYPRIVNAKHLERLEHMLKDVSIVHGGVINKQDIILRQHSLTHPLLIAK